MCYNKMIVLQGLPAKLKFDQGESIDIRINPEDTVLQVKRNLFGLSNDKLNNILLTINGKILDNDQQMKKVGFQENTQIKVRTFEIKGGPSFKFNDLRQKVQIQFSINAPRYRIVSPGLVFEAKCSFESCIAFEKNTLINKGFGTFDIGKIMQELVCPICKTQTQTPTNLGYYFTKIKIEGRRASQKKRKIVLEQKNTQRLYNTFKAGGELESWSFIQVTTEKIID